MIKSLVLNEILNDSQLEQIQRDGADFVVSLTEALKPYGIDFVKGKTVSAMCKASEQYKACKGDTKKQSAFVNEVKSILKHYKLGEYLTLDLVVNKDYWIRFNGSTAAGEKDNNQDIKAASVSLMRPDVKASAFDTELKRKLTENESKETKALAAQQAAVIAAYKAKFGSIEVEATVTPVTE